MGLGRGVANDERSCVNCSVARARCADGRGVRRVRRVGGRWIVAPAVLAFIVIGGCAAPVAKGGAGDGGVAVATPTAASGDHVDIVISDTRGLAGPMTVVTFESSVKAGDVTFTVKNLGTIEHELVVLKTNIAFDKLPIADAGDPPAPVKSGADKVSEDANIGETGDPNLKPGDTRVFVIKKMVPGKYVLVCNIARHYGLGMTAPFTVLP
jgi:uncharacterized cupredoxin-like copper-binding protein